MSGKLKTIGLLLSPLLIGLSSAPQALAVDEGAAKYCHAAIDFIGCMRAKRDGSVDELRRLREEVRSIKPSIVWLVLRYYNSIAAFPTNDMNQCEMQAAIWTGSKRIYRPHPTGDWRGFECLEGIR